MPSKHEATIYGTKVEDILKEALKEATRDHERHANFMKGVKWGIAYIYKLRLASLRDLAIDLGVDFEKEED